jgi:hypothetical protein
LPGARTKTNRTFGLIPAAVYGIGSGILLV